MLTCSEVLIWLLSGSISRTRMLEFGIGFSCFGLGCLQVKIIVVRYSCTANLAKLHSRYSSIDAA